MAYVGNATPNFRNLSSVITPGVWNHIAWVWNGATSVMTCYLNGVAGAPVSIAGGLNVVTNGITIGVNCDTLSQLAQSTFYQPHEKSRSLHEQFHTVTRPYSSCIGYLNSLFSRTEPRRASFRQRGADRRQCCEHLSRPRLRKDPYSKC